MVLIQQFRWEDESTWPRDLPSHVFLARAVHQVGEQLFGDRWTRTEPAPRLSLPDKLRRSSGYDACVEAHDTLKAAGHTLMPLPSPPASPDPPAWSHLSDKRRRQLKATATPSFQSVARSPSEGYPCPLTEEQWSQAVELREKERGRIKEDLDEQSERLNEVKQRIIVAAETGEVVAALRDAAGGAPKWEVDADLWLTEAERVDRWFQRCAMSKDDPYCATGTNACWIYLQSEGLAQLIARTPRTALSGRKQSPRDAGETAIRALWASNGEYPTDRQIRQLAADRNWTERSLLSISKAMRPPSVATRRGRKRKGNHG